jgi:hypothetical protein
MTGTSVKSSHRDAEIANEIARIRQDYPYQGNYREQMAALLGVLFFKFGERVGANRLASLLAENGRSPSTSTAQDEINKFWAKVQENAAIKLNRPDLPPFLLEIFSNMAGSVWEQSMAQAEAHFVTHRQEVAAQIAAAEKATAAAREQLTTTRAGTEQALQRLQVSNESREQLGQQLAAETARLVEAHAQIGELAHKLAEVERIRATEAGQLQSTLEGLKNDLAASVDEQRRQMTIGDELKQQAARDRALRTKAEDVSVKLQAQVEQLQAQVSTLTSERGVLEGITLAQERQIAALTAEMARPEAPAAAKSIRQARIDKRKRR